MTNPNQLPPITGMTPLIDNLKKALEFWQSCWTLAVMDDKSPPKFMQELAIEVYQKTGERFDFETGEWKHEVNLPWSCPGHGGDYGFMVVDSKGYTIAQKLRQKDAEMIVRAANRPAYTKV